MDVQVQIPDDVAHTLQIEQPDLSRAAVEALALEGYRRRRLSEAQLRRMLGFRTRMQVHEFLKANNVYLNYSVGDLERDLESLSQRPPFHTVGTRRRLFARDLMAYKSKRDGSRRKILDDLSRAEQKDGIYNRLPE